MAAEPNAEPDTGHVEDLDDGCGCAEVWEHLSEHRSGDSSSRGG